MSRNRRLDSDRVVIDDVLLVRSPGQRARSCASCDLLILPGEARYRPARGNTSGLVDGRRTRLCVPCVDGRLANEPTAVSRKAS